MKGLTALMGNLGWQNEFGSFSVDFNGKQERIIVILGRNNRKSKTDFFINKMSLAKLF